MNKVVIAHPMTLALAMTMLVSACATSANQAPSASTTALSNGQRPTQNQPDRTIYFGSGDTPGSPEDYLIPVFTTARDILNAEGYDLQYASLATDEVVEAALDRGRIDVGLLSMIGLQRAVRAGLHMKWTVTNETQNTFVLVVPSWVTDLAQLRGKKVGTQDPTSLATAAIPGLLGPSGLTPNDYTLINLAGSANRAAALIAGSLDASMMLYTVAESKLISSTDPKVMGKWKIWGGGAAPGRTMMWEGLVMSDSFRRNTTAATAFVKAVLQAYQKFYAGDPAVIARDAIGRGYNELQGLDQADTTADLKLYQSEKLFPTDGGLSQDMFNSMVTALVAAGQMQQADAVPYADAVDSSFVRAP